MADMVVLCGPEIAVRWLESRDPLERKLYEELRDKVKKVRDIERNNLAVEIATQIAKSIKIK